MGTSVFNRGQSIVEILIAIGVGIILLGASTVAIIATLRSGLDNRTAQIAASLAQQNIDKIRALSVFNWNAIYDPPAAKGPGSQFYLSSSGTSTVLISGTTTTSVENRTFAVYFSIENVNRTQCGLGDISSDVATTCITTDGAGSDQIYEDPSTQKITINANWTGGRFLNKTEFITRGNNKVFYQTDWSAGSGQDIFPTSTAGTIVNNRFYSASSVFATSSLSVSLSTTGNLISSTYDTMASSGVAFNSILWKGNLPGGTTVQFQTATSSCSNGATNPPDCSSGSWSYIGPGGTAGTYYTPVLLSGTTDTYSVKINPRYHNNSRYFRYKIFITASASASPSVNSVSINWSP